MRVNESGVGLALTGQTPILTNNKVTSLGASSGAIPTLGAAPGTTAIQSLGAGAASGNGVNMTKLESYQKGASFAATQFFADIEGVPGDPRVDTAFEELVFQTNGVRLLGSYAQARKRG